MTESPHSSEAAIRVSHLRVPTGETIQSLHQVASHSQRHIYKQTCPWGGVRGESREAGHRKGPAPGLCALCSPLPPERTEGQGVSALDQAVRPCTGHCDRPARGTPSIQREDRLRSPAAPPCLSLWVSGATGKPPARQQWAPQGLPTAVIPKGRGALPHPRMIYGPVQLPFPRPEAQQRLFPLPQPSADGKGSPQPGPHVLPILEARAQRLCPGTSTR